MSENEVKEDVAEEVVVENADSTKKPKLWNPNALVNWSAFLFTPIFGAWLQAKNWEVLGDVEKSKKSMRWVYAGFAVLVIILIMPVGVGKPLYFPFLIAWYFASARKQAKYVKEELENNYERNSWKRPLKFGGIGLVCVVILSLVFSSPNTTKMLEKEAVSIVDEIIYDNTSYESAECVRVKIEEQVSDEKYKATALLDNGNEINVIISWDGETIGVVMSAEYF